MADDLVIRRRRVRTEGGYPVESLYVENFWLPRMGPSSFVMLRRGHQLLGENEEVRIDRGLFAASLGLSRDSRVSGPFTRTCRRLQHFLGYVEDWDRDKVLQIPWRVPILHDRHLQRLHPDMLRLHRAWLQADAMQSEAIS